MARQFLKRSVKRGGDRARLNQERIFQTWTISPMVKHSMVAKTRYLNHKLKSEEIKSTDNVGSGKWNWEGDRTKLNQNTISHTQSIYSKS